MRYTIKAHIFLLFFSAFNVLPVFGQISVSFTTTNNSGCGSLSTSFCSTSTSSAGAISSYSWDICGVTSTLECPGAIITEVGGCTVCLTVTDDAGNTETKCETDFVVVNENPEPLFSANNTSGCIPFEVTFSDETNLGSAPIAEWTWDIGGSAGVIITNDPNEIISTSYTVADSYGMSLTVEDVNGCTGTTFIDNYIDAIDATPITFTANVTEGCEPPFTVQFTNTTNDPTFSYTWDFGDGQVYNGETPPPITYNQQGSFSVTVSAESSALGCTTSATQTNFITIGGDVSFTASAYQVCIGTSITFTDTTVEPADSVKWDLGNGTFSSEPSPSVIYDAEGCYTVSLERYVDGCAQIETFDCIQVLNSIELDYVLINGESCTIPQTVIFSNQTEGVNSYVWEVLDDAGTVIATYSLPNSSHTFTEYGNYPIRLNATNVGGCSQTETLHSVNLMPLTASIPAAASKGCAPYTFSISDNTVSSSPITSWDWELITETGTINSTSMAPTFTLVDTGCADIKLTVLNVDGCTSTEIFKDAVCAGISPVIDFVGDPLNVCAEVPINFEASSDSDVTVYSWDFNGDGEFDSEGNPVTYNYQDTGYYDVVLLAEHNGCVTTLTKEDYTHIIAPVALFSTSTQCSSDLLVGLNNNSVGSDSVIWTISLPTGDVVFDYNITSFEFPDFGNYFVKLQVFNFETGCNDVISASIAVVDFKAEFTTTSVSGCAPFTFALVNTSVAMDSFTWLSNVGEIVDPESVNPLISFLEPGNYSGEEISLIIYNEIGCTDTATLDYDIIINDLEPNFTLTPIEGCAPLNVELTDNSVNMFGTNNFWRWDINGVDSLFGEQVTYSFEESGTYDITLTVLDDLGCNKSITFTDTISVFGPNAGFNADSIICTSADYTFENTTLGTGTYLWDFGNNTTSTEETPTVNYDTEGTYTVCLTSSEAGCSSTYCQEIIASDPVANFSADKTYAFCPPLVVTFANASTGTANFEWDFGDNTGSSSLENPAHVYTSPGTYDVTLISYNSDDCADTLVIPNFITIDGPVGGFDVILDGNCSPVTAQFTGTSEFEYNFIWDFGNGEVDSTMVVSSDVINYTYDVPGIYIPKLILVDDEGCENVFTGDSIVVTEMASMFTSADTVICGEMTPVTLVSTSASLYPITDYHWYIPGATPSEAFTDSIVVNYANPGQYPVTLVIENEHCKDSVTIADYVSIGSYPTANFSTQDSSVCFPDSIFFIDESIGDIVGWEWVLGDSMMSDIQNPAMMHGVQNDIPIQLTVENNAGCKDVVTGFVDVLSAIDATVIDEYEICKNEQIELIAEVDSTQGLTYAWQASPFLSCTDCLTPVASPTVTTTFYFVVSNGNICQTTYPVLVNVRPDSIPVINIVGTDTICVNEATQLIATGGQGPYAYTWDINQPGLSCYEDCSNPVATPIVTTTYYLTVSNDAGCNAQDSFTVVVNNQFMEIATEDQLLCEGDSVQLSVSVGFNPVWHPGTGLTCVTCPNPIAFPREDKVYTVTVETAEGCSITDSVYIDVVGLDEVDAGEDFTICNNEIGYLEGFGVGDVSWTPDFLINNSNTLTPNVSPLETTTYFMHIDNGACVLTDSVTVKVGEKTDVYVLDKQICEGTNVQMEVVGNADTYRWIPETGLDIPIIANPMASPTETTTYQVIATNGTCEPDTVSVDVIVDPLPDANLPPLYYFYPGQTLSINIESDIVDKSNFLWPYSEGLSCNICDDPIFTGDTTAVYNVVVRDPINGCPDTLTTTLIPIDECNGNLISVPNVFSPNGDDVNDIVYPYSTIIDRVKTFKVFSRWGELLFEANDFETNDPGFGWDGTHRGKYMQPGVYVYYLEGICYDGASVIKQGDITIFR